MPAPMRSGYAQSSNTPGGLDLARDFAGAAHAPLLMREDDPVSRREFWDTLVDLSSHGMTILVATPYLDEAERCHRVALMHQGQLVRTGTPAEIRVHKEVVSAYLGG